MVIGDWSCGNNPGIEDEDEDEDEQNDYCHNVSGDW